MTTAAKNDASNMQPESYFARLAPGRRGEILDAALAVFAEKGYEAGTMREIASRVGVTEPALYRHYSGKEALYEDVIATAGDFIVSQADSMLGRVRPDNLRESLRLLLEERRRTGASVKPILRTLMLAAPHNPALRETFRAHVAAPMIENLRRLIPRVDGYFGIRRTPEELEGKVRAFMSIFVGYFMTSMLFADSPPDDAIADAMLAVLGWDVPTE